MNYFTVNYYCNEFIGRQKASFLCSHFELFLIVVSFIEFS